MTMAMSKQDRNHSDTIYKNTLSDLKHVGKFGWYLAHRERVGLGKRGDLRTQKMEYLQAHFCRLMKPSNMFLAPKAISGIAEIEGFFDDI